MPWENESKLVNNPQQICKYAYITALILEIISKYLELTTRSTSVLATEEDSEEIQKDVCNLIFLENWWMYCQLSQLKIQKITRQGQKYSKI